MKYRIICATILEGGESLEIAFKDSENDIGHQRITLTAEVWQQAIHLEWLLRSEQALNSALMHRLTKKGAGVVP